MEEQSEGVQEPLPQAQGVQEEDLLKQAPEPQESEVSLKKEQGAGPVAVVHPRFPPPWMEEQSEGVQEPLPQAQGVQEEDLLKQAP
jgi:hypothetical protein